MPVPKRGEVLVQIEAAGVNYADTVRRWGDHYPLPTPLPAICGSEVVGTVTAVGDGVDSAWVGQRIVAAPDGGSYAEFVCIPEPFVYRMPRGLHAHQGLALFIQGLTAALVLKRAGRLAPGESVLVEGAAGGVGWLGTQLASLYGASKVFAAVSSPAKRARLEGIGAKLFVDYTKPGWSKDILSATEGGGVDLVMEMTGGEVFAEALQCLATGGRIVAYGIASRKPFQVPSQVLIARGQAVQGFYLGRYLRYRELVESTLEEMAGFVRAGTLEVEIGGEFKLAEAAEAHRLIESRASTGKIIVTP